MLIDVALRREPHFEASAEFLVRLGRSSESVCIAWHTVSNFYYVVSRENGDMAARRFIADLLDRVEIAPTDADSVRYAAGLPMADFEDALQVAAARACGARHIVTRNLADFAGSRIPAVSPREALSSLS